MTAIKWQKPSPPIPISNQVAIEKFERCKRLVGPLRYFWTEMPWHRTHEMSFEGFMHEMGYCLIEEKL